MGFLRRLFLTSCTLVLFVSAAQAITLDWSAVTWTAGSLSNSYDVDPAKVGNDITVTVSGNTTQLQPELASPYPATPSITTDFQGGMANPVSSLCLAVNFSTQSEAVTVTVDFSSLYSLGVQNVSFTLFDIDEDNAGTSTYQDQLRNIVGTAIDGSQVAPTITTSSNNALTGTGLSQVVDGNVSTTDLGPGSGAGNVTISFGSNAIKSFVFTYGSGGPSGVTDPTYQHVGIYNVSFTPVPEINPAWSAVGSCLFAAALILRHSAKFRK
jgi:hypothetical protein